MRPGRGVTALVAGVPVAAGNPELLRELGIVLPPEALAQMERCREKGDTVTLVAASGRLAGLIALSDTLREDAAATIRGVKAAGVTPVLLTGDHEQAARQIAGQLQMTHFQSECRPEDKLNWITARQMAGERVCMIGDGINDAPRPGKRPTWASPWGAWAATSPSTRPISPWWGTTSGSCPISWGSPGG